MVNHQPALYIGGAAIAGNTPGAGLLPLAEIRLDWGRPDLLARPSPTTIEVEVIDETGGWATNNDLVGKELRLERDASVVMFRGSITAVTLTTRTLTRPDGRPYRVYVATLEAACRLADLDRAIVPGPGATGTASTINGGLSELKVYGPDHWPLRTSSGTRVDNILAAAAGMVSSIERNVVPTYAPGLPLAAQAGILFEERRSLLWLIEAYYNQVPLATVNYNPETNGIELGRPAPSTGLALTYAGGVITLAPVAGKNLPANTLQVGDTARLRSTVNNAITAVVVDWYWRGFASFNDAGEYFESPNNKRKPMASTAKVPGAPAGTRLLTVATTSTNEGTAQPAPEALAAAIAAALVGVNGQFTMPPVTLDFRRAAPAADLVELLLATRSQPTALYLLGSQFAHLPNVGPQFQIIGGTLQWHPQAPGSHLEAGWSHTLTLAPTVGRTTGLTLAQLATTSDATLAAAAPEISLADLGHLTIGLP